MNRTLNAVFYIEENEKNERERKKERNINEKQIGLKPIRFKAHGEQKNSLMVVSFESFLWLRLEKARLFITRYEEYVKI